MEEIVDEVEIDLITEANVNGETSPSSIEALQLMNMFIP
jgi:hypothetical protein